MNENRDEEGNISDTTTYDKAKAYWNKVDPSISGMLGGIAEVGYIGKYNFFRIFLRCHDFLRILDIQASSNFLKLLFKFKPAPGKTRALDCGAGIGRVSKNLLMNEFEEVSLVEQDEKFCAKARETLSTSGRLGEIYNMGLQDFDETGKRYDVVWSQWVLGHLTDEDLVCFFKRISKLLEKNGMFVVKENFTKNDKTVHDETDSSVTRPLSLFKKLVKKADLKIVKEARQTNFPKNLFPVYMIAMRPIAK